MPTASEWKKQSKELRKGWVPPPSRPPLPPVLDDPEPEPKVFVEKYDGSTPHHPRGRFHLNDAEALVFDNWPGLERRPKGCDFSDASGELIEVKSGGVLNRSQFVELVNAGKGKLVIVRGRTALVFQVVEIKEW